ncbi:MFS transporter [Polynucleobacter brandtiae]|uniref:MFS-type transporter involved in bile tolerance (Atg22 family) n=1 Tax=Polynucleobacter brandtiae TaxID=1938816 RepID=A0A2M8VPW3_9BURK|nr:MFS transporter [Polynucleobacter brandtiae]PJI79156.1 MFS-type transporter involved in bile tolerance (Atg22 family) [Polynucleobacter brandtiae]
MLKTLFALPRTVWLIGLISFVNDSASEMLYPLMPMYLATVLMAGPKALGIIEGIAEATSSIFKLVSGVIVDRTKKAKPWIVLGYTLAGIGRPLIVLANSWLWVLAIRFTDRMGKGLRSSPRDALLAETVQENQRGITFGLHRSMDNAGAVVGPLLAAMFLSLGVPLRDIFLWAIVPAVITITLALCIKEPYREAVPQANRFSWSLEGMPNQFKRYLVVAGIFALANSSDMFLLLRAREAGVPQEQIPLLWAAISLITTLFGAPLSALSDTFGRKRFILIAWIAFAFFYFAMGLPGISVYQIFGLFGIYGLFKAATEGVEKAFVADMAPKGLAGTAFGWFNLITGLMLFPASFIFGWIYESVAPLYAFLFSGSCALVAFILMALWVTRAEEVET